jgi:hypothetical protein
VAREFELARWRPERRESTVARNWWLSPWRAHRRSMDMHNTSYCDVVRHLGTWRTVDRWPTLAILSESPVNQADTVAGVEKWPKFILNVIFLIPSNYLYFTEHESQRHRRSWRRITGGEMNWTWDIFDIVPSVSHSVILTDHFAEPRSHIFMWTLINPSLTKL